MRKYFHFLNFTQLKWWKQCWRGCLPLACVNNFPISAGVQYFNNQINKLDYYEWPSNHILIWFIISHVFNKLAQTSQNIMKLYCWLNAKSHKKWQTLSIILSGRSQIMIITSIKSEVILDCLDKSHQLLNWKVQKHNPMVIL